MTIEFPRNRLSAYPWWHYKAWLPDDHPFFLDWMVPGMLGVHLVVFWMGLLWPGITSERLLLGLVVSAVSPVLLFAGLWQKGVGRLFFVAAMLAICLYTLPYTEAGYVFLLFSLTFLSRAQRKLPAFLVQLLVVSIAVGYGYHLEIAGLLLTIVFFLAVFGGLMDEVFIRYIDQHQALLKSQSEAEELARTAERERIARDLHDLLGHTLSGIRIKAELAERILERDPVRARQEMKDIEKAARESLQQVRAAVSGYHLGGLALEINSARSILSSAGVRFVADTDAPVPAALEPVLGQVLREGVTNIVCHANASEAHLTISHQNGRLLLQLRDNGSGLNGPAGNGITGIRSRVQEVGGMVRWRSDNGTTMVVGFPLGQFDAVGVEATT
ncbi:sensor histidine kinase [Salinispirillum sp. LH 10-3-1]|uniref:Sensor histidine kinase n=1 Tax=Salinispirillum sp. LH 10-3-1 TaxID=2952525 RepID=A0AB38YEA8_9GAMM